MFRALGAVVRVVLLMLVIPAIAGAQATAVNGNIEGIVRDTTGARTAGRRRDGDEYGHRDAPGLR